MTAEPAITSNETTNNGRDDITIILQFDRLSEVFRFDLQTQVSVQGPAYVPAVPPVRLDEFTFEVTLSFNRSMPVGLVLVFAKQDAFGLSRPSSFNVTLPYGEPLS